MDKILSMRETWPADRQIFGENSLRAFYQSGRLTYFAPGQTIANAQIKLNAAFFLIEGEMQLSVVNRDGREAVTGFVQPGMFFGLLGMIDGQNSDHDATAVSGVYAIKLSRQQIHSLIEQVSDIRWQVLNYLTHSLRGAHGKSDLFSLGRAPSRLARQLLELVDSHGREQEDGILIDVAVSQEKLGMLIGTTRQTANKHLAKLEEDGYIERSGRRLRVIDLQGLRALIDGNE